MIRQIKDILQEYWHYLKGKWTNHKWFDSQWESGRVQQDLSVIGKVVDYGVQHSFKVLRQQFISLQLYTSTYEYNNSPTN